MIQLLVVDDQDIFRQNLATLLSAEDDLEVIGQARHGQEAITLSEKLQPDVILMDVRMPVCDGVTAISKILQRYPWIRILVLTMFDDDEYILQSLQSGALGYLLKRTPAKQIAAAVRAVHLGHCQLGPTIVPKVFSRLNLSYIAPAHPANFEQLLSDRELQILRLLAQGKSNSEMAQVLHLSEGTVKNYLTRVLNRLGLHNRTQAALWAQQNLLSLTGLPMPLLRAMGSAPHLNNNIFLFSQLCPSNMLAIAMIIQNFDVLNFAVNGFHKYPPIPKSLSVNYALEILPISFTANFC